MARRAYRSLLLRCSWRVCTFGSLSSAAVTRPSGRRELQRPRPPRPPPRHQPCPEYTVAAVGSQRRHPAGSAARYLVTSPREEAGSSIPPDVFFPDWLMKMSVRTRRFQCSRCVARLRLAPGGQLSNLEEELEDGGPCCAGGNMAAASVSVASESQCSVSSVFFGFRVGRAALRVVSLFWWPCIWCRPHCADGGSPRRLHVPSGAALLTSPATLSSLSRPGRCARACANRAA